MISHPALSVISAAILAYEVLLVRLFAIVQWHHFAFMAISVALLGFGVSGALLALFRAWAAAHAGGLFGVAALAFALAAPMAFLLAQNLPFNALAVFWMPSQLIYLGVIYLLLAIPFTAGAICIGLAFIQAGGTPGRVYLWNLVGSGAGAIGIVGLLFALSPMTCLLVVGALGFAAAAIGAARRRAGRDVTAMLGIGAFAAFAWTVAPTAWRSLQISEFKGLSEALAMQEARVLAERSGPLAFVSVVESPIAPFRYAPGLSLQSPALPPGQLGIFVDGAFAGAIDIWDGDPESLAYLDQTTDALAYHLVQKPAVLALGAGDGRAVRQAIHHGVASIDAVEVNRDLLRLGGEDFGMQAGKIYARREVEMHLADPRHFLATSDGLWDLISLPPALDGGAPASARGLGEDYLYTAEALRLAYRHLAPNGWISISGSVDLPPRTGPKLVSTMRVALEAEGIARPAQRMLMIRGMTTVTLLAKRAAVSDSDIAATRAFVRARGFDLVHYPGIAAAEANRHNRLTSAAFFEAAEALLGPEREAFTAGYRFDIAPATDDRPYFHDFFKWAALPELLALGPAGGAALLQLGELIVMATLIQALLLGVLLVLLPLCASRYRRKPRGTVARFGAYFTLLGLAFLFVEMAWIQKFVLFLGHPLYAVSIVLTGFLVFAGIGAGVSAKLERLMAQAPVSPISAATAGIVLIALGYLVALPRFFEALATLAEPARIALSLGLIGPLGFLMGMPFPLGLARVARADPDFVPWAWGLNGCASVISAAAAILMTMHLGFSATILIAAVLYTLAAFVLHFRDRAG